MLLLLIAPDTSRVPAGQLAGGTELALQWLLPAWMAAQHVQPGLEASCCLCPWASSTLLAAAALSWALLETPALKMDLPKTPFFDPVLIRKQTQQEE